MVNGMVTTHSTSTVSVLEVKALVASFTLRCEPNTLHKLRRCVVLPKCLPQKLRQFLVALVTDYVASARPTEAMAGKARNFWLRIYPALLIGRRHAGKAALSTISRAMVGMRSVVIVGAARFTGSRSTCIGSPVGFLLTPVGPIGVYAPLAAAAGFVAVTLAMVGPIRLEFLSQKFWQGKKVLLHQKGTSLSMSGTKR